MSEIIYAENLGDWIEYDVKNVVKHFMVHHDDYPLRNFWEKGVFYDFDLILYHNKESNKKFLILSYWDVRGKVLSCPDCSMSKLWYVHEYTDKKEGNGDVWDFHETLKEGVQAIPKKVYDVFLEKLNEYNGFVPYKPEEVVSI